MDSRCDLADPLCSPSAAEPALAGPAGNHRLLGPGAVLAAVNPNQSMGDLFFDDKMRFR